VSERLFMSTVLGSSARGRGVEKMLHSYRICATAAMMLLAFLELGNGQQLCPGSKTKHCTSCPDRCQSACTVEDVDHVKCIGSSWGNTNSTYMGLDCKPPPGIIDKYPYAAIMKGEEISSPLNCNGTIKMGQWPFDADNMTFTVDTTFRDPTNPSVSINTLFLPCLTMSIKPKSASFLGQEVCSPSP
jgi:hypothetical protein